MIEKQHLNILYALNIHGTLSAAAASLNLTQSALSHSIRKLEHLSKAVIWEKRGRKAHLTQAGEFLLNTAENILPQLTAADKTLKNFAEGKQGKLRIGMECHPCYEWLMAVVPSFLSRWPKVDLDVVQQFHFDGLSALLNYKTDVVISSDPIENQRLRYQPVLDYELLLVVPETLVGFDIKYLKPAAVASENLISFPVEKARLDIFTQCLLPAKLEPKTHQHVETIEIMLQLVAAGRGVCSLPDWLVNKYKTLFPIKGLRVGKQGIKKTLHLAYRTEDANIAYLSDFVLLGSQKETAEKQVVHLRS